MSTRTQKLHFLYPEVPNLVSIVMCVYNSAPYLQKMLDSIYAQTYKKFEVIAVYDVKSTDKSLGILKEYMNKYGLIIDCGNDSSIGFARARGARLAQGEYFIYLDSDDVIIPTYLDDLLGCFRKYPEINIAYSNFCDVAGSEQDIENAYRRALHSSNIYSVLDLPGCMRGYHNPKSHNYIRGSPWNFLVRRHYLQEIECFFPDLQRGEDHVYVCQLIVHSKKIGHSSRPGYLYIRHPQSLAHKQKSQQQELQENKQIFEFTVPLLTSAGFQKQALREERNDYKWALYGAPILKVLDLRVLPYPEFLSALEKEGIKRLPLCGSPSSYVSSICFNISKRLYWVVHHYLV